MTIELVRELSAESFKTILLVGGPVLATALFVGLAISFVQAITQMQEFTLTFVPKIVAVFLCIVILLPWMASVLIGFTVNLFENIPAYVK
ncbi:MAG: flagellar biosynthesis protein FliQ [Thermodesulfovibrionales bacterium]